MNVEYSRSAPSVKGNSCLASVGLPCSSVGDFVLAIKLEPACSMQANRARTVSSKLTMVLCSLEVIYQSKRDALFSKNKQKSELGTLKG